MTRSSASSPPDPRNFGELSTGTPAEVDPDQPLDPPSETSTDIPAEVDPDQPLDPPGGPPEDLDESGFSPFS